MANARNKPSRVWLHLAKKQKEIAAISVAIASFQKCLTMWKCCVLLGQEEVAYSCSKGGIRQKLRLSDCLTHVEKSSLTSRLRGLKEVANKQVVSKTNKMRGSFSAWDQRHCSWLLVGWPQWQWAAALWEALPGLGSSSAVHLGLGQAARNPSEPFVPDFAHPCKQTKLLQSHSISPVDLPS